MLDTIVISMGIAECMDIYICNILINECHLFFCKNLHQCTKRVIWCISIKKGAIMFLLSLVLACGEQVQSAKPEETKVEEPKVEDTKVDEQKVEEQKVEDTVPAEESAKPSELVLPPQE